MAEIAKPLSGAGGGEQREERIERVGEPRDVDPVGHCLVQPGAFEIAADIERIRARHPADDADVAAIGAGAAVRAASDADTQPLLLEAPALSRTAIASTMSPWTRSASVRARPQLGKAGQARAQRSTGACPRPAARRALAAWR